MTHEKKPDLKQAGIVKEAEGIVKVAEAKVTGDVSDSISGHAAQVVGKTQQKIADLGTTVRAKTDDTSDDLQSEGLSDQIEGTAKKIVGQLTDDKTQEAEGRVQEAAGRVKRAAGGALDSLKKHD